MSERFTARDVADIVVKDLRALLDDVKARMPGEGELKAISAGITSILKVQTNLCERVERLEKEMAGRLDRNDERMDRLIATATKNADNFGTVVEEFRGYHRNTIDQYDKLGARVVRLEDWRKGGSNDDETKLIEGLEG